MTDSTGRYSRRRVLALAGAAGLAGCSSSGPDDSGNGETTEGGGATSTTAPTTRRTSARRTTEQTPDGLSVVERYDLSVSHDAPEYDEGWSAPTTAPPELATETLIANLEIPWDLSFAADGTLFLTERVGRIRAFDGEEARVIAEPADAIDAESVAPGEDHEGWFVQGGEGGLLGITAHPEYPDPPVVYVYYTVDPGDGKRNRLAGFDAAAENPAETITPLVTGIPADAIHNGGRVTFGPENYLWVTCGDAGQRDLARDPSTLNGTVLRLTPSGDPAPDNPDHGGDPRVFTYGHRNPQGIVWLPDGTVVASEHGPGGRDEINRLEPGANYGWPDTRQREEYPAEGVHSPLANSGEPPSWAPTGALFYTGEALSGLHNRLLVGGLFSQQLLVATMTPPDGTLPPLSGGERHDGEWTDDAYTATINTALNNELGRIRHVEQGPDGGLYAITSNRDGRAKDPFPRDGDDVLVRLTEA